MDAAAKLGRNPVSKHQIQPEYGDEQADAGWDCRTRLARPNSAFINVHRQSASLVHKIRLHGRPGKGMAESFSREKLRHAPQKEGG